MNRTFSALTALILLLCAAGPPQINPGMGSIRCEIWNNVDGAQITDTLANGELSVTPHQTQSLANFELDPAPQASDACALRGYLIPPATGEYKLMIAADNTALLFLSDDDSVDRRQNIASVPTALGARDYKRYVSQTSKPIKLEAGKHYFVEALMKNDGGPSHVSVAWKLPDGTIEAPIPGTRLMPAIGNVAPPPMVLGAPILTLKPEIAPVLLPGFQRFPKGAHIEWPHEAMDMSYLIFTPNGFDKTTDKKPLLVFLHGNSHQGTNLLGVLDEGPANYLLLNKDLKDWFPMIALFPQLPSDWRWDRPGAPQAVNALVKQMCQKYPRIDENRIYLTGLSMGGKGAWLTALDSPGTYAAVTTFSAVAVRPQQAKTKLAEIKNIRIICGGDDGDFAAGSKAMFDVLQPVMGTRVQFTAVPHQGHSVWTTFYPQREFYQELMQFSK